MTGTIRTRLPLIAAALAILVAILATPALAGQGNNGNGNAHSDNGSDAGSNSGNGNSNGNGNGARGVSGGSVAEPDLLPRTSSDAAAALQQVDGKKALPLADLLAAVGRISEGRVLEIGIVKFRNQPAYEVTLLEKTGRVRRVLFEAGTGKPIGTLR